MSTKEQKTTLDKIIIMTKQLCYTAKYSPDIRKCAEVAVDQIVGNKELSQHCIALGITKKDYIDFILKNL